MYQRHDPRPQSTLSPSIYRFISVPIRLGHAIHSAPPRATPNALIFTQHFPRREVPSKAGWCQDPAVLTLSTKQLATATGSLLQLSRSLSSWLGERRVVFRPWTTHNLHGHQHTPPPQPPGAQTDISPGVSELHPGQQLRKGASTAAKMGAKQSHALHQQEREKAHQYPPQKGTQLLCRQKESNTQKQTLKGEGDRQN